MRNFLRAVPLFSDLPDEDLDRFCDMVDEVHLPAGQVLFSQGDPGDNAYIVKSGEVEVIRTTDSRPVLLAVLKTGAVIGEIALLEEAPRNATVRARVESSLYEIHQDQFNRLLNSSPSASRVILNTVLSRWRSTTAALRQSEKMAQLGTMTAGVAHEINNPTAAVKRGAGQLEEALSSYANAQSGITRQKLSETQYAELEILTQNVRQAASKPPDHLDPLTRSDLEYEIETRLDELGVVDAWEYAPTLVNLGYRVQELQHLSDIFSPDQIPAVVSWLGTSYDIYSLLAEIGHGAERISKIVKALKSYVYLDQAPAQQVNIHEGIDDTLLILRNKLTNIKVIREYAEDLPEIQAYGSELNQVWTNLIDNAADALENTPKPEIIIRTSHEDGWVKVDIEDNGPGIPSEIQSKIFDPFFTTKPPGKGTGLGLEISYKIVVDKHLGDMKVFSKPGQTIFRIMLPEDPQDKEESMKLMPSAEAKNDELAKKILETFKNIAVVGISSRPERPAHSVPAYLQAHGYRIIPVNPNIDEVLGEKAYPDLLSIPEKVDVVEIFRPSEEVEPIVEQAIEIGAKAVWMQEGIVNEQAYETARQAGLDVMMDICMRATHQRLFR